MLYVCVVCVVRCVGFAVVRCVCSVYACVCRVCVAFLYASLLVMSVRGVSLCVGVLCACCVHVVFVCVC